MATTHDLKIWPDWYELVVSRKKEFEIRKDDRQFEAGDTLNLRLYDPKSLRFLGPVARCRIGAVMRGLPGLMPGYVAMSIIFITVAPSRLD